MNILVTGAAGFVAANLIPRLLSKATSILGLDDFSRGQPANLSQVTNEPRFKLLECDVADIERLREIVSDSFNTGKVDEIWHLAANSDIVAGIENPGVDLKDTFMTTYAVLRIAEEFAVPKIMFASSSAIYGDHGSEVISETTGPLLPISNYGAMKLASEASITAYIENSSSQAFMFRFPNVVGIPSTHGVILDFVRKLKNDNSKLEVLGNGTQRKAYMHVSDLVDAMFHIVKNAEERVNYYNVGPSDDGVTVQSIAERVVSMVAPQANISYGDATRGWVGDVPRFNYSVEKLSALGWQPKYSSSEAIAKAVEEIIDQER